MRSLVAVVTGFLVLLHSVVGCCEHSLAALVVSDTACRCQHAGHDEHSEPAGECEAEDTEHGAPARVPHECAHASCHWIAGDASVQLSFDDFSTLLSMPALLPVVTPAPLTAEFRPDNEPRQLSALPLRLHLAIGVLLI